MLSFSPNSFHRIFALPEQSSLSLVLVSSVVNFSTEEREIERSIQLQSYLSYQNLIYKVPYRFNIYYEEIPLGEIFCEFILCDTFTGYYTNKRCHYIKICNR